MAFVHMIRNKGTGQFSTGGQWPGFSSKGKMWISTNSLNSHLALFTPEDMEKKYKDCELVAFELTEKSTLAFSDIAERNRRKKALLKLHNDSSFVRFIDDLDAKAKTDEFPWVVYVDHTGVYGNDVESLKDALKAILKSMKIKKSAYRTSAMTFAFASRTDAAMFRLSIARTTHTYDSRTLLADPLEE